jgi:hypothetical protein
MSKTTQFNSMFKGRRHFTKKNYFEEFSAGNYVMKIFVMEMLTSFYMILCLLQK